MSRIFLGEKTIRSGLPFMRGQESEPFPEDLSGLYKGAIVQQAAKQPFYFCKGVLIRRESGGSSVTSKSFFLDVGSGGRRFSQQLLPDGA